MKLFRLRPLVVQAVQVTGTNHDELAAFCGPHSYSRAVLATGRALNDPTRHDARVGHVWSERYRVWLGVHVGDWVERGVHQHLDVVRPHHVPGRYMPMLSART